MHVLIAPDKFAGTLTAAEAAAAIADGWRRAAPADTVELLPLADGGPGFADVIGAALPGRTLHVTVSGPFGEPVPGRVHLAGETGYIEAADACGLHLVPAGRRDPGRATSYGVGELLAAAVESGVPRIVVGLGGSATNDAGAGLLAALGAKPAEVLRGGGRALSTLVDPSRMQARPDVPARMVRHQLAGRDRRPAEPASAPLAGSLPPSGPVVDVEPARRRLDGVELVIASDVDNILYGPSGASLTFGPQKGATAEQAEKLDAALRHFAQLVDWRKANQPGAGAAGGLGYALLLLGGRRMPGAQVVLDAVGALDRAKRADIVLTGEGAFDWQSLHGKVVAGVARVAQQAGRPCVVLAGQVMVGHRELGAVGVDAAYSVAEIAGSAEASLTEPATWLAALAARVARTWSH